VVDESRVLRLLDAITRDVLALRVQADSDIGAMRTDEVWLAAMKYRFVTAIEGVARVANHLVVSEGWGAPESNADAVARLAEQSVIDGALAGRLGRAVGFRNVLVHQYVEVDDDQVVAALDDLGDLEAFVTQVARWITSP
jgi:uncharacterized protein YutE (UPF0331/DUF86 family)